MCLYTYVYSVCVCVWCFGIPNYGTSVKDVDVNMFYLKGY